MSNLKIYIISGEASGDMHGANLIKELKKKNPEIKIRAWGGDLMQNEGAEIVKHYRDLAFMGFLEVILNLKTILKNIKQCKKDIVSFNPDAVILIDYPGFNLRIGRFAKRLGIKVFYYISPQVWAWKQNRVHKIKQMVDEMYTILPFEKEFYRKFNMDVQYVGHPLLDELAKEDKFEKIETEKPIIALLPGSRKQEIKRMLPIMLDAVSKENEFEIAIAGAPSISNSFYKKLIGQSKARLVDNKTYNLLYSSKIALVTSGTATLETALFEVPQLVCYKGNIVSYIIARRLVKVKYISLVNLIMNRELVKELIQQECNSKNISDQLQLLKSEHSILNIKSGYKELKDKLGGPGASELTASLMLKNL